MERVSDIDIQSLHSALSEVLISPQSSKAEEEICLSMTSKSASDMGIDHLLAVLTDHSHVVKRKVQARQRAKKKRLLQDIEEELQFHNQMPKRRKHTANVPMDQKQILADDGEVLLEDHHTMATSSAHTLKALPERDLSFRFDNASDEPPWAIMKRANRWKAKTAAVEL